MRLFISLTLAIVTSAFVVAQETVTSEPKNMPDTIKLQEIVVSVSRPISKIEGDGMVTSVQGTALQDLGTAKDVLGYIPGVQNNNGSIEVIGKGAPVIYLNGRVVRSQQEIDALRSNKIKDIKLITNPGAKYGGDVNSVIRITTVRNLGDGFSLDSRTSLFYRDYFGGKEDLVLNYRTNGLDIFSNLEYDNDRAKSKATNIQDTWTKTYDRTHMNMAAKNRSQFYNGKIGFNYVTLSSHSFGLYYQLSHKPTRGLMEYNSDFFVDNVQTDKSILNEHVRDNYTENLIDAYYSGNWGAWKADITFDALWRNNDSRKSISESSDSEALLDMSLDDSSRGRLLAGELNLSRRLGQGNLSLGGQYSNSNRTDVFRGHDGVIDSNDDRINEGTIGVYAEYSQNFRWVTAILGLRYEHIYSNYYEYGVRIPEQSKKFDELLPSLNLNFMIGKTMLQLGYSRKYTGPLYSQLSNRVIYINQYLYESGNPNLRSVKSNNVTLNMRWSWLTLMCSYRNINGQIMSMASAYDGSESITLLRKENSSNDVNSLQVLASIMPGMVKNFYYPVLTAGFVTQFYKVKFLDGMKRMNRPMPIVQLNNLFFTRQGYRLSANFKWRGKGDADNITLGQAWNIDLGVQKAIDKHWTVKFSANDIFNTSRKNKFIIYSNLRRIEMENIKTSRNFELTVNYKFNTTDSKYKGKGTRQEEKDRLK